MIVASTWPARADDGTPAFVRDLSLDEAAHFDAIALVPAVPGAPARERIDDLEVVRFRFFPRRWEDLAHGAILENLRARPSRWLQVVPLLVAEFVALRRLVRRHRPDVLHLHWLLPQGLVARLAAPKVPQVLTTLGGDVYALQGRLASRLKAWVVRRAAFTTVQNADMRAKLVALGGDPERVLVQPLGADVATVRAVRDVAREPGRILFAGRLAEKKGVGHLIEAVRRLGDDLDWRLDIVGDGPPRARLEAAAADLGDRVTFHGALGRSELVRHLARCTVFALPSVPAASGDQEGLPLVLLEAMAAGCAIVASRLPGIDEVVEHERSGLLVPPGDPDALAAALRDLLTADQSRRDTLGAAASATADDYSLEAVEKRFVGLLERAVAGSAPRSA